MPPSITDPAVALFAWYAAGLLTGLFAIPA
jgi:hypothetical protein